MPEIEPRIVEIVVKYSAITSLEDISDNGQCCLRGTTARSCINSGCSSTGLLNKSALRIIQVCTEIFR